MVRFNVVSCLSSNIGCHSRENGNPAPPQAGFNGLRLALDFPVNLALREGNDRKQTYSQIMKSAGGYSISNPA
jgi:hypothetical protein